MAAPNSSTMSLPAGPGLQRLNSDESLLFSYSSRPIPSDELMAAKPEYSRIVSPAEAQQEGSPKPPPTLVSVKVLIDECKIITQHQGEMLQFKAVFCFHWTDERFKNFPLDQPMPSDVWRPEIMMQGEIAYEERNEGDDPADLPRQGQTRWRIATGTRVRFLHSRSLPR
ncbi:unnamed protein product [Amoebophrya sp. A120]|nr:unnamed protein product [Amoebophrya sp. A120]|eukprot:GSA120T00005375001.1